MTSWEMWLVEENVGQSTRTADQLFLNSTLVITSSVKVLGSIMMVAFAVPANI